MSRLHSRIYIHSLGVLLVVGVASALVVAWGSRDAVRRDFVNRLAQHVATLAAERFFDRTALQGRLNQLHDDLGIDVTVWDLDGRAVATTGTALPALKDADAVDVHAGKVVTRVRPTWYAAVLIRQAGGDTPLGVLAASAPHRPSILHLVQPLLWVGLVLLVVAVATRPLARRISRPLELLTLAARRFGSGDLSYRIPLRKARRGRRRWRRRDRQDELQTLTRAFNEMAARVERIVQGQKELLANVSHELRSPVTRIRMALELLPRDGESEARLQALEEDLADLDRLIEDVLTTARLEATGLPTQLGPVDTRALLAQIAERAQLDPLLATREVQVAEGPAVPFVGDEMLLKRAIWNLVENSAKYGAPPITLAATRQGDEVKLSVTDEGEGIPAVDRQRVFTPFFRAQRERARSDDGEPPRGVGLGLTLALRVAEVHGGAIAIEAGSVVDGHERGCRVVITLPAKGS